MKLVDQYPGIQTTSAIFSEAERDAVYRVIQERRDIRHFRPEPVSDQILHRLVWAAHRAGSVGFMQPWSFIVVRDPAPRRRLRDSAERQRLATAAAMGEDPSRVQEFLRIKVEGIIECSAVIVVTVDPTRGGNHVLGRYSDLETDAYSASCAIENLWLAARAEGVGVGWVSFFHPGEVQQALEIPPHVRPLALLCLGWPDAFPARPLLEQVGWETRRRLGDVVFGEAWGRPWQNALETDSSSPQVTLGGLDHSAMEAARTRQATLTKPAGSLGRLEALSVQLAGICGRIDPELKHRVVFTLAADHGVSSEGVSAYPREVTGQMVANFLAGGAAINVLAAQMGARVVVADLGVECDIAPHPQLADCKVRRGTDSITQGPAMTPEDAAMAVEHGRRLVRAELERGLDVVLTGDMGIGNTTASAALVCALTGADPDQVVGRGTGVDDAGLARKREAVRRALEVNRFRLDEPMAALAALGGLEIAGLVGVILQAAQERRPILVDGFISAAAALVAVAINPGAGNFLIASHRSQELGHQVALDRLGLVPLLDLELRLGEGTGAVLALPLLEAAVRTLNQMATFSQAGVSGPEGAAAD
ncbi:MAG TPA: nicotinate-nucleotide--dimethylbenzimidazole phosphoribosyltransferase [Candidatus Nitrosotalea sp.]|nr:nicotinate-nucleotide--dimethylbenzimidazole phosphoribosyltransferase [Candidatus Nitrosotalea sp.]